MGRKILLVTTDQQRFDTLACNGGTRYTPAHWSNEKVITHD